MFCKHCGHPMNLVYRFEDGKSYTFNRCRKCHTETRKVPYYFKKSKTNKKHTNTAKRRK